VISLRENFTGESAPARQFSGESRLHCFFPFIAQCRREGSFSAFGRNISLSLHFPAGRVRRPHSLLIDEGFLPMWSVVPGFFRIRPPPNNKQEVFALSAPPALQERPQKPDRDSLIGFGIYYRPVTQNIFRPCSVSSL